MVKPRVQDFTVGGHIILDVNEGNTEQYQTSIDEHYYFVQSILSPVVMKIEGKDGQKRRQNHRPSGQYGLIDDVRCDTIKRFIICNTCKSTCLLNGDMYAPVIIGDTQYYETNGHCNCLCHNGKNKSIVELRLFSSWLYDLNIAQKYMDSVIELSCLTSGQLEDLHNELAYNNVDYDNIDSYNEYCKGGIKSLLDPDMNIKEYSPTLLQLAQISIDYKIKNYNVAVFPKNYRSNVVLYGYDGINSIINTRLRELIRESGLSCNKTINIICQSHRDSYTYENSNINLNLTATEYSSKAYDSISKRLYKLLVDNKALKNKRLLKAINYDNNESQELDEWSIEDTDEDDNDV